MSHSITGRALFENLWSLKAHNIRDFATDSRKTVDDKPCSGGAGMVLKPDILASAIDHILATLPKNAKKTILYPSPRGKILNQKKSKEISQQEHVIIICGRYEGIDQRVIEEYAIEEISLGDFILTCGEIPAFAIMDSAIRLLPGAIGSSESLETESFSENWGHGSLLEFPLYTKPINWRNREVPEILLSGNHLEISKFKLSKSEEITKQNRPDLWQIYEKTKKSEK